MHWRVTLKIFVTLLFGLRVLRTFHGHYLRLLWREEDVAIYERSLSEGEPPHELELVIIRVRPGKVMPNGVHVAAHEAYPAASEWGTSGWSFPVRYKQWVLGLGRDVIGIRKNRAVSVREASHRLWGPGIGGAGQDGHCREKRLTNRLLCRKITPPPEGHDSGREALNFSGSGKTLGKSRWGLELVRGAAFQRAWNVPRCRRPMSRSTGVLAVSGQRSRNC